MTNYQLSKHFCFCPSYFHQMELNNKEKYNLIFSFDKNRKKSVLKYCSYVKTIILKMKKILDFYENKTWLFGKTLIKAGISKDYGATQIYLETYYAVSPAKFDLKGFISIKHTLLIKWEKIIQLLYKKLFLKKIVLFQYRSKRNKSPIKS